MGTTEDRQAATAQEASNPHVNEWLRDGPLAGLNKDARWTENFTAEQLKSLAAGRFVKIDADQAMTGEAKAVDTTPHGQLTALAERCRRVAARNRENAASGLMQAAHAAIWLHASADKAEEEAAAYEEAAARLADGRAVNSLDAAVEVFRGQIAQHVAPAEVRAYTGDFGNKIGFAIERDRRRTAVMIRSRSPDRLRTYDPARVAAQLIEQMVTGPNYSTDDLLEGNEVQAWPPLSEPT